MIQPYYDHAGITIYNADCRDVLPGPNDRRFPANLIHDGSEEVMAVFPETMNGGQNYIGGERNSVFGNTTVTQPTNYANDSGSAARFFYCAKASGADRSEDNNHPTVKPSTLMRYLCQLISPPDSIGLDPFMGSGTTLWAAKELNRHCVGIEIEEKYCEIAAKRLTQEVLQL